MWYVTDDDTGNEFGLAHDLFGDAYVTLGGVGGYGLSGAGAPHMASALAEVRSRSEADAGGGVDRGEVSRRRREAMLRSSDLLCRLASGLLTIGESLDGAESPGGVGSDWFALPERARAYAEEAIVLSRDVRRMEVGVGSGLPYPIASPDPAGFPSLADPSGWDTGVADCLWQLAGEAIDMWLWGHAFSLVVPATDWSEEVEVGWEEHMAERVLALADCVSAFSFDVDSWLHSELMGEGDGDDEGDDMAGAPDCESD